MTATDHPSEDRLFDLAHDLLSERERRACLGHAQRCAPCEDRLRELVRDRELSRLVAPPERGRFGWSSRDAQAPPTARRSWPWRSAAAAATVLILVGVPWILRGSDAPDPYWLPIDSGNTLLRSDHASDRYMAALAAYEDRDARRVVELLEREPIPLENYYVRLFYASALLLEERHADARAELDRLQIWMLPEPARRRAHWMLYSCYRRAGEDDLAAALLARLVEEPGQVGELARAEQAARGR